MKVAVRNKGESLWIEILKFKYGCWRDLDGCIQKSKESRWWKDLKSVCGEGVEGVWFNENTKWILG